MSKELEVYKFCEDKEMEWNGEELTIWINFDDLEEFTNILSYDYMCDGGISVMLQKDCVAFNLVHVLEYLDIEPTDIFGKEE